MELVFLRRFNIHRGFYPYSGWAQVAPTEKRGGESLYIFWRSRFLCGIRSRESY